MAARHAPRPTTPPVTPGTADSRLPHAHARSDGVLEPAELVRQARAAGVRLLAIADHDNLAGVPRADRARRRAPARTASSSSRPWRSTRWPAASRRTCRRASCTSSGSAWTPATRPSRPRLTAQRDARRIRFHAMVDRLREIGLPIDAQVAALDLSADDALGRPTVARALMAAGHATDVQDAFTRLIGHGCPAYVPRAGLDPDRRHPRDPRRRRPGVARALRGGARARAAHPRAHGGGAQRPRDPPPVLRPRDAGGDVGARQARRPRRDRRLRLPR